MDMITESISMRYSTFIFFSSDIDSSPITIPLKSLQTEQTHENEKKTLASVRAWPKLLP